MISSQLRPGLKTRIGNVAL